MSKSNYFQIKNISKSFGPTHANKNISLSFDKGEIRGLVGENGSGKSTISSIIAGILNSDEGQMNKNGREYHPDSPVDANSKGVSIVVQELGLVQNLTVAENIFLGKTEKFSYKGIINRKELYRSAEKELKKWKIDNIPVNITARDLSVEEKKLVELTRALLGDPDIIIFDEITAALSQDKREFFYELVQKLKKDKKIVIFISHDLQENIDLADKITIMKDGEVVDTVESSSLNEDSLKRLMVGRDIKNMYHRSDSIEKNKNKEQKVVMEVKNLSYNNKFKDVNFSLYQGEILGLAGLNGSGTHILGKALFGLIQADDGMIYLPYSQDNITDIFSAINNDISYVPKDRDDEGLMLAASIKENICLPSIDILKGVVGFISPVKKKKFAQNILDNFQIKANNIEQNVGELSGGNKQKVSIGSWMVKDNKIMILDCPTRGVDVGVKAYIYNRIVAAKEQGIAMILISDELPELIGISDRIIVMKEGKVKRVFNRNEGFSENSIVEVMI